MQTLRSSPRSAQAPTSAFWRTPALPFIEGRRAFDAVTCYHPHTHPSLSVGIVDAGSSLFTKGPTRSHLQAGDVVLINPGQVHSCNPSDHAWSYRMFYVDVEWAVRSVQFSPRDLARKGGALVLRGKAASSALDQMTDALLLPREGTKGVALVEDSLRRLIALFGSTDSPSIASEQGGLDPLKLERARSLLEVHCAAKVSVKELAREAGLTTFEFIRRFRARFGLTPHAYQLNHRIIRAKELLSKGVPLPEIAYSLGFVDQSHFQRAFKQRVAATPGQYQLR